MGLGNLFGFGKRTRTLVLHIDDSALVLETTKSLLASLGCDAVTALSGADGIELARKHKPDLILVDAMMPGMDGYQTTRALKEDPTTKEIPVLMLTGNDQVKSIDSSRAAGADGYIVKPIVLDRLKAKLQPYLGQQGAS